MKKTLQRIFFLGAFCLIQVICFAQNRAITGIVSSGQDRNGLPGVTVAIKGAQRGTQTGIDGKYSIEAAPADVLVYSFVGMVTVERVVGNATNINVSLEPDAKSLDEVVVTALGIPVAKKPLSYAVTEVKGADIAQTQRENFVNSLAGRVAGVEVVSTSGLPGASASITIRGISSLSGNNQPLFVVDGLPINNSSFNTGNFAGASQMDNRGADYGNRASDINPEDIESITVLKGPEASARYGIDAASGAIVITTKRGKAGTSQINYSNSFRLEKIREFPVIQQVYDRGTLGVTDEGSNIVTYFGSPYPEGTKLYDNVGNFFQTTFTQKHNLSFSGGNDKSTYRVGNSYTGNKGFVPNTGLNKFNLTAALTSTLNRYISTDISFGYTYQDINSAFTGAGGPLLGLLAWPQDDDASNYLLPNGERRMFSNSSQEIENAFFNVNKNKINRKSDRYITSAKFTIDPTSWLKFVGSAGIDYGTMKIVQVRHQESNYGKSRGGIFDQSLDNTRNLNIQYYGQAKDRFFDEKFSAEFRIGSAINDQSSYIQSVNGERFLTPGLFSIENTDATTHRGRNRLAHRRLVGAFTDLQLGYNDMLYLNLTARKDWTSTLPKKNNSFMYPSAGLSFLFTELQPFFAVKDILSMGKLRATVAQVGKDVEPYMLRPWLEARTTTGGGFGYAFNGPSEDLRPEITTSYEIGAEFKLFNDRVGIDATYFNKTSKDQIVRAMRLSYGTGFIQKTFNAGEIQTEGFELQINATPVKTGNFTWDVLANFFNNRSTLMALPSSVPEFYNSDTWLYNNVRNGSRLGGPVNSFTAYEYLRNKKGEILINPTNGYPLRDLNTWNVVGNRTPDFMVGLTNTFSYKSLSLNFLIDFRKGGDVFNATEHFLTVRGLSMRTLDREAPRVFKGVLKDGLEDSDTPTKNNIVINPAWDSNFYSFTSGEVDFIEKDVNWIRLRDVTLRYVLPKPVLTRTSFIKTASVFVTGTDLYLATNYSGLDPIGNGNNAAVGGSGGAGFDLGNFPLPLGLNFGLNVGF